jgi:hypothetical protein
VSYDAAYFFGRYLADKQKWEEAHKFLSAAGGGRHGMFVFRADAKALLADVTKKLPEKKEEPKKEEKK